MLYGLWNINGPLQEGDYLLVGVQTSTTAATRVAYVGQTAQGLEFRTYYDWLIKDSDQGQIERPDFDKKLL